MIYSLYIFHRNRCIFVAQYFPKEAAAEWPPRGLSNFSSPPKATALDNASSLVSASSEAAAKTSSSAEEASSGVASLRPAEGERQVPHPSQEATATKQLQAGRLLSGLLFSMRVFCQQISPSATPKKTVSVSAGGPLAGHRDSDISFTSFCTPTYRLHYLETPTGYKFACLTNPEVPYMKEALHHVYVHLFVEIVIKGPAFSPSKPVHSPAFAEQLQLYLRSLPCWGA